jgi:hypothetical protein
MKTGEKIYSFRFFQTLLWKTLKNPTTKLNGQLNRRYNLVNPYQISIQVGVALKERK